MRNFVADFKRNNKNPITLSIILTYRFGNCVHYKVKIPIVRQLLWITYLFLDVFLVRIIGSGELPAKSKIGKGFKLPHSLNGVIIHPDSVIGENVTMLHQVTVGSIHTKGNIPPTIGNGVVIGAGAKIVGNIKIGNNVKIGTNAVVLKDVPDDHTAVGNPARNVYKLTS
ncbi:MAG: serine O-acetyltransferase [Bacillota bacterium]